MNLLQLIQQPEYKHRGIPLPLCKQIARQTLQGLDYLHRICHLVHTGTSPKLHVACSLELHTPLLVPASLPVTADRYRILTSNSAPHFSISSTSPSLSVSSRPLVYPLSRPQTREHPAPHRALGRRGSYSRRTRLQPASHRTLSRSWGKVAWTKQAE